jgi:metal-sulfur cluster biosynthetic enzyme
MRLSEKQVLAELRKVLDPEIGIPITEMKLVDKISIKGGEIEVRFHLTTPFCPPVFAKQIGMDIRRTLSKLEGVEGVRVVLTNHYMAEQITKEINE